MLDNDQIDLCDCAFEYMMQSFYGYENYIGDVAEFYNEKTGRKIEYSDLEYFFDLTEVSAYFEKYGRYLFGLTADSRNLMKKYGSFKEYYKHELSSIDEEEKNHKLKKENIELQNKVLKLEIINGKYQRLKNMIWILGIIWGLIWFLVGLFI